MPRKAIVATATVTGKGQITIPNAIRKELGLVQGTRVRFEGNRNGMKVVPVRGPEPFSKFVGIGNPGIPEGETAVQFFRNLRGDDDFAG